MHRVANLCTLLCVAVSLPAQVTLSGRITDAAGIPLAGALVSAGADVTTRSDGAGLYAIRGLQAGTHIIRVTRIGYAPDADTVTALVVDLVRDYRLVALPQRLSQVTVSPGTYSVLDLQAPSQTILSREELLTRPQLAEDLFRTLNRLPGFSGSDFSAQLRIRNSSPDELLVMFDGMELLEPFHMKDFDGSLTIIDQDAVGSVEINTGGFGAAFGNRAAGLLLMQSPAPAEGGVTTTLGLSLSNARVRSSGSFADGRGGWQLSARRGYIDIILGLLGEDEAPDPTYYDVFARTDYRIGRHLFSAHTLLARDRLTFAVDDGNSNAAGSYGNYYLWGATNSLWTDNLQSRSLTGFSALSWRRNGQEAEFFGAQPVVRAAFRDRRALNAVNHKQDFTWNVSNKFSTIWGGEVRREFADFSYVSHAVERARVDQSIVTLDSTNIGIRQDVDGWRMGGYVSLRMRPATPLTFDIGARVDRHTWTSITTVTPRLNARWDFSTRTAVRAAWGTYAQAQTLNELSVIDGDSLFATPERSQQRIIGVEHNISGGLSLRTEVYERRIRDPRPRWLNADGELDPFPEGQLDRLRFAPDSSRVRGIEALATWDRGERLRITGWYNHLTSRANVATTSTVRPFEERHSGAVDLAYRWPSGLTMAAAWSFHSGWPSIPASFRIDTVAAGQFDVTRNQVEPPFSERLEDYHRVDLRFSRVFHTKRGTVSTYAEVFNLLDRGNQRGWEYDAFSNSGRLSVLRRQATFVGRLPTIGVRWSF